MDAREELARQLHQEHREGMAADRLEWEAAQRGFTWDIEGWTNNDELKLYIAGSGLHLIPANVVAALGNALLAEHQLRYEEE